MISTPSYDREQTLDKYLYLPANKESVESLISKLASLLNESLSQESCASDYDSIRKLLFDQFPQTSILHIHNRFLLILRATLRKIALLRHFILFSISVNCGPIFAMLRFKSYWISSDQYNFNTLKLAKL